MADKEKTRGEKAEEALGTIIRKQLDAYFADLDKANEGSDPPARGEGKKPAAGTKPAGTNGTASEDPFEIIADILDIPK